MTTKLVSANMGIVLVVEKNGKQERKEMSEVLPRIDTQHPLNLVEHLLDFLNEEFGMNAEIEWKQFPPVKIARPAKIKARKTLTQNQFNEKIKELQP